MGRKLTRKGRVRKLDEIFAKYIKARDRKKENVCLLCRMAPIENCFHFISRYFRATRWDELNAIGTCAGCNIRHEHDPHRAYRYFLLHHGQEVWDKMYAAAKTVVKDSDEHLEELILHYEMKLGQLLT